MIDISKLKYYKVLFKEGVIGEEQNDLDSIMNTLEEKQFEYLKRLETTNDEHRKDEINELLNTIDLQLKEISSLKAAINSGIIIGSANEEDPVDGTDDKDNKAKLVNNKETKDSTEKKKRKTGVAVAITALIVVVAVASFFMLRGNKGAQDVSVTDNTNQSVDNTEEDENAPKVGLYLVPGDYLNEQYEQMDETPINLLEGLYILEINNQSLLDGGIQLGDRIVTVNGENAKNLDQLDAIIEKYKPGDSLEIVVSRGFEQITISGVFIKNSERLPARTSGEEIFEIDGRPFRVGYDGQGYTVNAWKYADE